MIQIKKRYVERSRYTNKRQTCRHREEILITTVWFLFIPIAKFEKVERVMGL